MLYEVITGVDLVEGLPRLDVGAFGEQALLDDAADLRPHLGDPVGGRAPGEFGGQHQRLRSDVV